jgi:hypothetical protein
MENCLECIIYKEINYIYSEDIFDITIEAWKDDTCVYVKLSCDKSLLAYEKSHPFRFIKDQVDSEFISVIPNSADAQNLLKWISLNDQDLVNNTGNRFPNVYRAKLIAKLYNFNE